MKTSPSANFTAHIARENDKATTLATIFKVTRTDATQFFFTDHDANITYSGDVYLAEAGFKRAEIEGRTDFTVDNTELEGIFNSAAITEADLRGGLYDFAEVEMSVINWAAPVDGALLLRKGWLGEMILKDQVYRTELRGLSQALARRIGEVYSHDCRADLFDTRCALVAATYAETGMVVDTVSVNRRTFTLTTPLSDGTAGYYDQGQITWTTGANTSLSMELKTYTTGTDTIICYIPMPFDISPGDTLTVYPGCKKRAITDCKDKYNNIVNFRGEPYVPGQDEIVQRAESGDGGGATAEALGTG